MQERASLISLYLKAAKVHEDFQKHSDSYKIKPCSKTQHNKKGVLEKKIMFKCFLHVKLKENVQGWDSISKHVSHLLQDIHSLFTGCVMIKNSVVQFVKSRTSPLQRAI